MKKIREYSEILLDIKKEIPEFNEKELLEYAKVVVLKLYNALKEEQEVKVNCDQALIDKLNSQRSNYRMTKNFDHLSIQHVKLYDFETKNDENYIQIYMSLYFYDNGRNNMDRNLREDQYWNDIWIVTCKERSKSEKRNCDSCGAIMKYNNIEDVFQCEYCGNKVQNIKNSKWEIADIERLY